MNNHSSTTVTIMQAKSTRFLKKWLHLPSPFSHFNPQVLGMPNLPHFSQKAKLKSLTTIFSLIDPLISDLSHCQDIVLKSFSILDQGVIFSAAVRLVSKHSLNSSRAVKRNCKSVLKISQTATCNEKLNSLVVYSKFRDIVV